MGIVRVSVPTQHPALFEYAGVRLVAEGGEICRSLT